MKDLYELAVRHWPRVTGLVAALLLDISIVGIFMSTFSLSKTTGATLFVVLAVLAFVLWHRSRRIPRPRPGKVGFAIAIKCEDSIQTQFRADFIEKLRREVRDVGSGAHLFQFLEMPPYACEDLYDTGDILRLLVRSKAHFLLVGSVRTRVVGGEQYHLVELRGLVRHAPLSSDVSAQLAKEFTELLPSQVKFKADGSVLAFEFTASIAGLVAKYIIGIAAGLSGDLDYAELIFTELRGYQPAQASPIPTVARIRQRLPTHLSQIAAARAFQIVMQWSKTRDRALIDELGTHVANAKARGFLEHWWVQFECLHVFLATNDPAKARRVLNRIPKPARQAAWYLNEAFLKACQGNLKAASTAYRVVERLGVPYAAVDVIVAQIEDFLIWRTEVFPDSPEPWYCLGVVNWRLKGDLRQALQDFSKFQRVCPDEKYKVERTLISSKWVPEIEAQLSQGAA